MSLPITKEVKDYWLTFIESDERYAHLRECEIDAWSFGNTKEMANDLGALVLEGKKTATCSLLRAYRGFENEIPRVGLYSVLCDGDQKPLCIIFLTNTWICPFNEIDERQAYEEGEGDRSLEYWRRVHRDFFNQYGNFDETEELVCERFKVIFKI